MTCCLVSFLKFYGMTLNVTLISKIFDTDSLFYQQDLRQLFGSFIWENSYTVRRLELLSHSVQFLLTWIRDWNSSCVHEDWNNDPKR